MSHRQWLLVLLLVCGWPHPLPADTPWPEFRGPRGDGHSAATGLPLEWTETQHVRWSVPVPGRGWSSPVVLAEQVWMTTAVETLATADEKKKKLAGNQYESVLALATSLSLRAVCFHLKTGELLHDIELFRIDDPEPIHQLNSYATPTPVIEPGRLYCDFGTYGTACVELPHARVSWRRRLPAEHQVGPASSPLLYRDLLILVRDGCDRQYVAGLDKRTGQDVWVTDRPEITLDDEFKKAFSTPLLIAGAERPMIVVPGAQWVVAYDPRSGRAIWRLNYERGYSNVARPVSGHGMVYVCSDGQLWAIRHDGRGDVTDTHVVWKVRRQIPKRPSPLLYGDQLYLVSDRGVATCLDAHSGREVWNERIAGNYSASPLLVDGSIYFFSEQAKTTVMRAGSSPERLAENRLAGRIFATPAVAERAFLIRTDKRLYRIEKR